MFKIFICIIFLSIIPLQSYSFDAKEHVSISESAFMLSLIHAYNTDLICCDKAVLLKECFVEDNKMNFGKLSKIVDDVDSPSKLIKLYGPYFNVNHGIDCEETKKLLKSDKIMSKDKIMVSRYNLDHFQGEPLTKFREWHELALLYAVNKDLTLALVLNAFAAHYLEDFFAPGHVLTPRTDVSNIVAMTLHEINNTKGAEIKVTTEKLEDYLIKSKLFIDELKNGCEVIPILKENMKKNGIDAIKEIKENMKIYGDGMLTTTPGERELIIYEVAKTITAIFEAYNCKLSKSLGFDYKQEVKCDNEADFWGRRGYEEISATFDDVSYKPIKRDYVLGRYVPIVEITGYSSTPLKQGIDSRVGLELDLAAYAVPYTGGDSVSGLERKFYDMFLYGGAVGYDVTWDAIEGGTYSHGPLIKYMFDIKNTDIGLSVYAKYIFNDENGHKFQSVPFGGRMSISRDFFSLFIGAGYETHYADNKENVLMLSTGLTLHVPPNLLPGWLGIK